MLWNGTLGVLALVELGQVSSAEPGRPAWLARPYEMLGPFSLDELETQGCIAFAACLVMSRAHWQQHQVRLRREALAKRREAHERQQRYQARRARGRGGDERQHRQALNLPPEGALEPAQIRAAFRRLAQKAHPDTGGSHEQFIRITEARNALLERD